jgi:hypothetical protein
MGSAGVDVSLSQGKLHMMAFVMSFENCDRLTRDRVKETERKLGFLE